MNEQIKHMTKVQQKEVTKKIVGNYRFESIKKGESK